MRLAAMIRRSGTTRNTMDTNSVADTVDLPPPPAATGPPSQRPSTTMVGVDVAALSDQGRVRRDNQDHFLVVNAGRYLRTVTTSLPAGQVPVEFGDTLHGMVVA